MAQFPAPASGILITYFVVARDIERSRLSLPESPSGRPSAHSPA
jgi:hypothetical protein